MYRLCVLFRNHFDKGDKNMSKKYMSLFLVFTIIFTFAGPAYSTVIYPPGTAPAMQGPLYDENGNEYHYSPGHGGYMSNGSMLPSGHPLYDKKGGKGNVYYAGESSQQNYQRSSEVWTALGAFLGFMIINAIVNNDQTENKNENTQYLVSLQEDIDKLAENEKHYVTRTVGKIGVGNFLTALQKYCQGKNMPHSSNVYNNTVCFSFLNNEQNQEQSRIYTEYTYLFNSNTNTCDITVSAPSVRLSKSVQVDYVEPTPRNFNEFGLNLMKEPGIVNGYVGYYVNDITPMSRAHRLGIKKSDHIIKINNYCMTLDDDQKVVFENMNNPTYKDKYPSTLYILRHGIIEHFTVRM